MLGLSNIISIKIYEIYGKLKLYLFSKWAQQKLLKNHYMNKVSRNLTTTYGHFMPRPETKKAMKVYGKSTLCLRRGIKRYFNLPSYNRGLKFSQNPVFKNSNMMLNAKIKDLKQGKQNVVKC